jgi:hypothetical protein
VPSIRKGIKTASVVFDGTVIKVEKINYLKGEVDGPPIIGPSDSVYNLSPVKLLVYRYTFDINKVYKGSRKDTMIIYVMQLSCAFDFALKERYIVYAIAEESIENGTKNSVLMTNKCTRTSIYTVRLSSELKKIRGIRRGSHR